MHNKIGNKRLPYNKKYKKGNISLDKNCINCYYGFRWIEESIINVKYWIVTGEAGKTKFYRSTEKLIYEIWFFLFHGKSMYPTGTGEEMEMLCMEAE